MPIEDLQSKGDLQRFVLDLLRRPDVAPAAPGPISLVKNGVPSDSDFPAPPADHILALDTATTTLYVRVAGEWKAL